MVVGDYKSGRQRRAELNNGFASTSLVAVEESSSFIT